MCEDMGGGSSGRGEVLTQACGSRKLFIYIYISVGGSVLVSRAVKKKELDRHFWGYKPKPSHVHVHLKGCRTIKR